MGFFDDYSYKRNSSLNFILRFQISLKGDFENWFLKVFEYKTICISRQKVPETLIPLIIKFL